MITKEKLDIVEFLLKEKFNYKGNRRADYTGPYFDYVRDTDKIEVFTEGWDTTFYWSEMVCEIVKAVGASMFVSYDNDKKGVYAHIY